VGEGEGENLRMEDRGWRMVLGGRRSLERPHCYIVPREAVARIMLLLWHTPTVVRQRFILLFRGDARIVMG
jgi:hypothetical protein